MAGIYIHVPFCKRKCGYCNFYSTTRLELKANYLQALQKELQQRRDYLNGEQVQTIYFGGGTPSLMEPAEIQSVIDTIKQLHSVADNPEITIEANPDDLTLAYIGQLAQTSVNRLSIGIQSFDDEMLKLMNRRHTAQQAIDAVRNCQQAGYSNISVDLIYGLPQMTADDWRRQLDNVARLNVQHLSAYHLSYEEGTAFGLKLKQHKLEEVSEDDSLEQFEILTDWAKTAGFEHYEISNFAKSSFRSRHNSSYWNRTIYLGVGPAAHSYNRTTRSWNTANTAEYIKGIESGSCVSEEEQLSPTDIFNDYVITALRTSSGIDMEYLEHEQPRQMVEYLRRQAESFVCDGRLEYATNHLKLTHSGIFISDEIMEALIVSDN
ncbi:MAG: radical SAM family heme chaperone HemW [Salinivirgaceae bacterium]|nr:radical SAM family heme chaperone HemW [Salinivirgaceae bacterium]